MFARKGVVSSIGRGAVMATVAAIAISSVEPSPARAGSASSGQGLSTATVVNEATDVSARRRYYRRGGGAAAAAAVAGIVGTGLAIAGAQNRRAYYDDYYGGPGYGYYGGGPYYGGYGYRGYGGPYYRGW
ncbi:MAG: hypothetical protein E6G79_13725 [Alphaproteobacteria bacterium]|nr:MAG: hypothetical protein E6G79_13725 [Alphaproteobacteria bacterium]